VRGAAVVGVLDAADQPDLALRQDRGATQALDVLWDQVYRSGSDPVVGDFSRRL
jgi:hypothetical protein